MKGPSPHLLMSLCLSLFVHGCGEDGDTAGTEPEVGATSSGPNDDDSSSSPVTGCGDGTCASSETCRSCEDDCGACPPCHAPRCQDFSGAPPLGFDPIPAWNMDLSQDITTPGAQRPSTGSSSACGAPSIQVALAQIAVVDEVQDISNDRVYCIVQAESAATYSVRMTAKTEPLAAGDMQELSLAGGLVWGIGEPANPGGNLKLTYDCFAGNNDTTTRINEFVDALGQFGGAIVEGSGYATAEAGSGAANAVKALISDNTDDHMINATQTLDARLYAPSALGRSWTVSGSGNDNAGFGVWGWTLEMRLWGCTEFGGTGDGCDTSPCYEDGACGTNACDMTVSCCVA